jgi:hypothetical protein
MPDFNLTNREIFQSNLIEEALNLFGETEAAAFKIKIPNTSPPLYIVVGAEEDIKKLIE